ncbi:hypothetical protein EGW08_008423 [Elysia chlorotica]|uniref:Major facilitator superfamily (MFS) profile domain-containing protein n=1 Tax=Elysia chlorotica TaxID=188477 RepID=A0A433TQK1_ELYCH|nr:hypothetical protein EGW08_008423 [Elysia chlorotica]
MGEVEKAPMFFSQRLLLAFMAFLGKVFIYMTRVNLSVAVVCMVRESVNNSTESLVYNSSSGLYYTTPASADSGSCGESSSSNKESFESVLLNIPLTFYFPQNAEFDWSKTTTGELLAMYFYGYIFTQIPGPLVGNVLTFAISGLLCAYGFDNGWGSIFYLAGIGNLLWVVAWFWLVADSPDQHPHISERERTYITTSIGKGAVKKVRRVPWLSMATSGPLWAVITSHMANNYLNYTLITSLPTFMKESLNFDVKENGALSALPYVCQFLGAIIVGQIADKVREKQLMSTKNVRKLFQTICKYIQSLGGAGICVAIVGQMGCEHRYAAVGMLCLCTILLSANRAGYLSNHLDLAPSYAGILYGITNTVATVPGMVAPIVTGALTPTGSADEWRTVFYVCAAIAIGGMIIFLLLADGELQNWAVPEDADFEVKVSSKADEETVMEGKPVSVLDHKTKL